MFRVRILAMNIDYIMEFPQVLNQAECQELVELRRAHQGENDLVFWDDSNDNPHLKPIFELLESRIARCIETYTSTFSSLADSSDIELRSISLNKHEQLHFDDLHYDTPIFEHNGKKGFRPFISVLYLNHGDFEGGQTIFPVQKKVIAPEAGKLVLFPTTFHFPHMVTNISGGDRFSIRLTYQFNSYSFETDLNKMDQKYDHSS